MGATIAVFGSWRSPEDQRRNELAQGSTKVYQHELTKDAFEAACRELGREVARAGHAVAVASDSTSTVDYHVVQGIVRADDEARVSRPVIALVRSGAPRSSKSGDTCAEIYADLLQDRPHLFQKSIDLLEVSQWQEVHDRVLERSERVLVIGGGASSHRIAVRALISGKLVVPVGAFGGAGDEIARMLAHVRDNRNFPNYEQRQVLAVRPWSDVQMNTALYALGIKTDPTLRRKVFINYRRSDTNMLAHWLCKELCAEFDKDDVFLDTDSIDVGGHFDTIIASALNLTRVFVVLIGPTWLTASDDRSGQRRLDAPRDFVRREIEIALGSGINVVPVCVGGARVPDASALPSSIDKLVDHNAHFISENKQGDDIATLVGHIKRAMLKQSV